jgi:hypothetical protein
MSNPSSEEVQPHDELLYFNGINGATGSYGLKPMTRQALSDHILRETDETESVRREQVEGKLKRDTANKILAIVKLLAESNAQDIERDATWRDNWLERLAQELAAQLLGDEYTQPDQIKELENRLRRHTVDKIVSIVEHLARGNAQELAALLLEDQDQAPDNLGELQEKLKRDVKNKIDAVIAELRAESTAQALEGDTAAQSAWLETLARELRAIPIASLNAIEGINVRSLDPLIQELDTLAQNSATPGNWLETLRQDLQAQPRNVSWSDLLATLETGLQAFTMDQEPTVSWGDLLATLNHWLTALRRPLDALGAIEGVDPTDLAQAGWGIIFSSEDPRTPQKVPDIKKALKPLLDLRQSQAGAVFKIYEGGTGYRPNDTASKFLGRHGARASDPADPEKVPYYLLLVGSPEQIPFHFQYQLDVQYAVGRIDFGDDMEAYANYARSVVAVETGDVTLAPRATFFGVSNPGDRATELSANHLVQPLYERFKDKKKKLDAQWQFDAVLRDEAHKARLVRLMEGEEAPAFLFTASHGLEFPKDDLQQRQVPRQGALLCQDWPGPDAAQAEIPQEYYLAGEDVPNDANLLGLIAFFFACYSAGTPRYDEYSKQAFKERRETIAERPFTAALPKAMLSLPRGGALAVVGHVERAWGASFLGPRQSEQIAVFESTIEHLLKGHPIGSAMEYFNVRYAALSTELTATLDRIELGVQPDPYEMAGMWTANNDARGYIVIGDPAVRLRVAPTQANATGRRDLE